MELQTNFLSSSPRPSFCVLLLATQLLPVYLNTSLFGFTPDRSEAHAETSSTDALSANLHKISTSTQSSGTGKGGFLTMTGKGALTGSLEKERDIRLGE